MAKSITGSSMVAVLVYTAIALCMISADVSAQQATATKQSFSSVAPIRFPGGTYKASNVKSFPASRYLSGSVITLNPGGLREPHWHNPAEWAIVLNGTCRATAEEQGKTRPADTWDYGTGDVWYFPANIGHAILGLSPIGCTYLAVYNNASFDEYGHSFGIAKWIAGLPGAVLSQVVNTSQPQLQANIPFLGDVDKAGNVIAPNADSFIVQGPAGIEQDDTPTLPSQTPLNSHRFALKSSSPAQVVVKHGGFVNYVDSTLFPIGKDIWGGILHLEPGALRVPHWHLNSDEWQYIANGTVEIGIFLEDGTTIIDTYKTGDIGLAAQGNGHYLKNVGDTPADIIVVFNAPINTGIDLGWFLSSFPKSWTAAALNTTSNFTGGLAKKYAANLADIVPPPSNGSAAT